MAGHLRNTVKRRPRGVDTTMRSHVELDNSSERLLERPTRNLKLSWNDLPDWMRDNEFILTGYRPQSNSYIESLKSLAYLHNQSINIYSHLLAAVAMVGLATFLHHTGASRYPAAAKEDWIIFGVFFWGMIICYLLSAAFHTFANHSHAAQQFWVRLDLLGIFTVTSGAFVPGLWYTFACSSNEVKISWILLDLGAQSAAAIYTLFVPMLRTPSWRSFRAGLFVITCSSAFYPIVFACYLHGSDRMITEAGAAYYGLAALLYVAGAGIYGMRWPESWRPGHYDIWGNSHQIFHVLIVLGLLAHLGAFLKAFGDQQRFGHC